MAVKASNFITLTAVVDVSACFRYYLLQSSTLAKPAKPTAKPPGGSWTDAEPSYTAGSTNSLYFVDLTMEALKIGGFRLEVHLFLRYQPHLVQHLIEIHKSADGGVF